MYNILPAGPESRVPIKAWTGGIMKSKKAVQQQNTRFTPIYSQPRSGYADVHYGMGSTVGSMYTIGAIIPACVGVDIGCGMYCANHPDC